MRSLKIMEAANRARGVEQIALEAGVSPSTVRKYIAEGLIPPQRKDAPATRTLEIQNLGREEAIRQGYGISEIARVFGVSRQAIWHVKNRIINGYYSNGNSVGGKHGGHREGAGRPSNDKYHNHGLVSMREKND